MINRLARAMFVLSLVWLASAPRGASAAGFELVLKAGEHVTLPFNFWCIEYGEPFPGSVAVTADPVPDGIVAVLRAANARGALTGDPYQSNLAIWRVTTGEFKDYAGRGTDLARAIYSDSLKISVAAVPTGTLTLQAAQQQGLISVTVTSLTPLVITQPTPLPGAPFTGQGVMEIVNVSSKTVKVFVAEGMIFAEPGNAGSQRVVAEAYGISSQIPPATGGSAPELTAELVAYAVTGLLLLAAGGGLLTRSLRRRPSA